ncbi:50S ribosomal protein L11 methyltransferase [Halobacteriovorax sp. HLS]|uniref:50S ribosomal protein L11 methyltransferase n=1 Tax=Halobacteriovorax sp. HLS TaxID=2234000 RepID=UPI000FD9C308|nr:50S ribosomal protein L11 methyltransferase [Halobacteriovorax sp. HLS]
MENKNFIEVKVHFTVGDISQLDEINALAMSDYACDGVQEFSIDEPIVDEILGTRAYSGGDVPEDVIDEVSDVASGKYLSLVYFFYQSDTALDDAKIFREYLKTNEKVIDITLEEKAWEDWNKEWRKFYKPIVVSDELVIVPEWQKEESNLSDESCIYIYPGMGFGTGEHQTTYLCLKLFMEIISELPKDSSCLDFGCGSGILGIAAIKKLSMPTQFCDIDEQALNNCLQNLDLNFGGCDLSGTSLVSRKKFVSDKKYELVFANILENVLILEKGELVNSTAEGGYLIVSGLLNHQVENIVKEYSEFKKIEVVSKDDWSAILFKKI